MSTLYLDSFVWHRWHADKAGAGWETYVETLSYLHCNATIVYYIDMRVKTNNQEAEATKCRCAGGGRARTWRRSRHVDGPASTQVATPGRTALPAATASPCSAGKWSATPKAPSDSNPPTALLLRPPTHEIVQTPVRRFPLRLLSASREPSLASKKLLLAPMPRHSRPS